MSVGDPSDTTQLLVGVVVTAGMSACSALDSRQMPRRSRPILLLLMLMSCQRRLLTWFLPGPRESAESPHLQARDGLKMTDVKMQDVELLIYKFGTAKFYFYSAFLPLHALAM